jgi:DNA-binding NarL/FixJ family response regulator
MQKRRVVLICGKHLWGESLEHILGSSSEVEMVGCWDFDDPVLPRLKALSPDLLIMADVQLPSERATCLTAEILEDLPDLSVIHVTPEQNVFRVYTSHTLPASKSELIDVISHLPVHPPIEQGDSVPEEAKSEKQDE